MHHLYKRDGGYRLAMLWSNRIWKIHFLDGLRRGEFEIFLSS